MISAATMMIVIGSAFGVCVVTGFALAKSISRDLDNVAKLAGRFSRMGRHCRSIARDLRSLSLPVSSSFAQADSLRVVAAAPMPSADPYANPN